MRKKIEEQNYEGVSLIEMIITIAIITAVVLVSSVTLNTLIKTSAISSAKTTTRQESEFVLELVRRNVRNSSEKDIYFYKTEGREFNETSDKLVDDVNVTGYTTPVSEGSLANEVHFRPSGYTRWVCIGYFPTTTNDTRGYIVKSSYPDNQNPTSCLDGTDAQYAQNSVILNSSSVYATLFDLVYYTTSDSNILVTLALQMESKYQMSFAKEIKPVFYKQTLVSTQKLTWE